MQQRHAEDQTGCSELWDTAKSRYFRNLCHFLTLGGILPSFAVNAHKKGKLFTWNGGFAWAEEVLGLAVAKETEYSNLQDAVVIYKHLNKEEKEAAELLKERYGVRFLTINELYCHKVAETNVTEEQLVAYIQNMGGKLSADGWWQIKFKRYTLLEVKFENGSWVYREGTQELHLRRFHSLSGLVPKSSHAVMLVVLNYLLTSKNEEDLRGRRAFMSNVFVDPIHVGYSHKLLDKFVENKLGAIRLGLNQNNWMPALCKDGDLVTAAKAYENAGYSVFMHKGAKYVVVQAECAGFARQEGKTFVAWHADKQAKLTGRNLFSVPTAGLYVEDDE